MTKAGTVDICFFRDEKQTVSISAPACIRTEEDGAKVCFEVPDAAPAHCSKSVYPSVQMGRFKYLGLI